MVLQIRADPMYAYDFCSFPSFWHILWHFPYLFAALWHFPVFIATSFACSSPRTASEESKMRKGSIKLLLFHLLLLTAATKNSNANVHNNKTNEIASIAFSKSVTPQPWNFCEAIVRVIHDPRVRRCFLIVERSGVPTPKSWWIYMYMYIYIWIAIPVLVERIWISRKSQIGYEFIHSTSNYRAATYIEVAECYI